MVGGRDPASGQHENHSRRRSRPGGGYCFCDDHRRLWFTDNNSGGSCCPDWWQVCEGVKEGTTCLDARAQGSALGLFVAAAVVSKLL